jgi:archaellin
MIDTFNTLNGQNILQYLYLLRNEFWEVNDFINALKNCKPFKVDVRESTTIQNALNISVVISYARNFKKSRGFNISSINAQLTKNFSSEEIELHKMIIDWRDQEYAHSDALPNDIQICTDGGYSRRVVRQLLEMKQLEILKVMVNKIRDEIEVQIKSLTKSK